MPRYQIQRAPSLPLSEPARATPWVIYDNAMDAYCALPDRDDPTSLLPLEWPTRNGAADWMRHCVRAWTNHTVPAPRDWSTWKAPLQSPWAGLPFVDCGICGCGTFEFRPKLHNSHWVNACPRCQ